MNLLGAFLAGFVIGAATGFVLAQIFARHVVLAVLDTIEKEEKDPTP